jgi:hypothetical protein
MAAKPPRTITTVDVSPPNSRDSKEKQINP